MATTESSAANPPSRIPRFSIDSSILRSRRGDSSPGGSGSGSGSGPGAIHDNDNADKKPVWNKPSTSSADSGPVMGAESWPALSLSARDRSPSSKDFSDGSSSPMPMPQVAGTPLNSTPSINTNANAGSSAAATSSENHHANGQRRPFRRNNTPSSSTTNLPNAAPFNTNYQNHSQRGGSYASASGPSQFPISHRNRNATSFPRGDGLHHGNRRNFEHGNRTGFSHRNSNGRDLHLQPHRGFGMMRPQMPMGPPSFPATSAQYMAAPQIGSYGGPMLYQDYVFMPHPPPEPMALVGHFPPLPMYIPSFDAVLYKKILAQVEFYFSADNLSRDRHLRGRMNGEGWVPVRVIAEFRKVAELTDNTQTVLEALRSSNVVEIKGEALRRRGDWDKYLLPRESSLSGPPDSNASLRSRLESMTLSERSREGD